MIPRWIGHLPLATVSALLAAGCARNPMQSALQPAGPEARSVATLWWVMFWICTVVFAIVLALTAAAILRRRSAGGPGAPLGNRFVIASGIVLPSVVLVGLLIASVPATVALRSEQEQALTIRVTGHMWWWEVEYPEYGITTANELQIPAGRPVRLELASADVIHSFWVPRLAGKMDLIPGMPHTLMIRADVPGRYRGQCAEYCGIQHALMAFYVVALPPEQFEDWVGQRRVPPKPPTDQSLLRGQAVFMAAGCASCHAINGTAANARIGPDLTHVGSRLTLGAGTLPNNRGNLAGWIANPQALKPGNLMPPSYIASEDLHPLVDYLESLK